jgi:hypothetical protein
VFDHCFYSACILNVKQLVSDSVSIHRYIVEDSSVTLKFLLLQMWSGAIKKSAHRATDSHTTA